jgi:30S ribosomal protein S31
MVRSHLEINGSYAARQATQTIAQGHKAHEATPAQYARAPQRLNGGRSLLARRVSPRLRALSSSSPTEPNCMGKGDRKTRRGKIYRGSFGKSRPKDPAKQRKKAAAKK